MKKGFSFLMVCFVVFLNTSIFFVPEEAFAVNVSVPGVITDLVTDKISTEIGIPKVNSPTALLNAVTSKINPNAQTNTTNLNQPTNTTNLNYVLLEPLPSELTGNLAMSADGRSVAIGNSIGSVTSFLFVLLVSATLIGGVAMFMAGGFTRMTTDSVYKKTEGNEKIRTAVYGMLAVLTMYLIILVINPDMLKKGLDFDKYKITSTSIPNTSSNTSTLPSESGTSTGWPKFGQIGYLANVNKFDQYLSLSQETTARLALATIQKDSNQKSGVSVNRSGCASYLATSCTNIASLPSLLWLYNLKNLCNATQKVTFCTIEITGGTEWWLHSYPNTKHGPNSSTFDLHLSEVDEFTKFIRKNPSIFKPATPWSSCNTAYTYDGYYFCDEKGSAKHWHVTSL